jgi:catechol 2,3-dioxygenase-like lactoylglutathione lyase family enzyme
VDEKEDAQPGWPLLDQLNLVAADLDATVAFYRRLGVQIEAEPGAVHVEAHFPNGLSLEIDAAASVGAWDSAWKAQLGGPTVLGFAMASREAVDELHGDLVAAGYPDHQPPFDAFWGGRYAIVEDPDGRCVGLMSPIDESRRHWPPGELPRVGSGD